MRKLYYEFFLLAFIFFPVRSTYAQEKSTAITTISHLGREEGLAGKQVNCGLQDSKGFIWFGTSNGLQRYDGQHFRLFTKEKNKLQDNNIVRIVEDQNQVLWILYGLKGSDRYSVGKVDLLDLNSYRVMSLTEKFGSTIPFAEFSIATISNNERKELIIATRAAENKADLFKYSFEKGFRKIISGIPVDDDYLHHFIFRNETVLFYGNNQTGIMRLDGKFILTHQELKKTDNIFPLGINAEGKFFAGTSSVNKPGKKFPKPLFMQVMPDGTVNEIPVQFFDKDIYTDYNQVYYRSLYDSKSGNSLIYQQKKGLFLFSGKQFVELADTLALKDYRDLKIYDYFTVAGNQHWICTSEGVLSVSLKPNHFAHLLSQSDIKLPRTLDHQVRSIYADASGNVFINSWGGFFRAHKKVSGKYEYEKLLSSEISPYDGFYYDGKKFWIASGDSQVVQYDYPARQIRKFAADSMQLWSGVLTKEGHLLIGAVEGFGKLTGNRFEKMTWCGSNINQYCWVYRFFYSRDGKLWAVTSNGLYVIDKKGCLAAHYTAGAKDSAFRIPFSSLHNLHEDNNGNFWMATNGEGLVKWDRKINSFQQFTMADGLSSNVLYAVLEDEQGFLWISSEYGLMRFNPENNSVNVYTTKDGISDNEFNRISFFKGEDGRMFFGGMNGVNAFYPRDFRSDLANFDAPLRIISYNQFDGKENMLIDKTEKLLLSNEILVNPKDKFFRIDFQLLDFEKGQHHYSYRIDGFDNKWNYIEENSIRISGLPAGKFTLHIRGQNSDGEWSRYQLNIPVRVKATLFSRWWFRSLLVMLIIAMGFGLFRYRTLELKKSKNALEKTVLERTQQLNISLKEKEMLLKEIHHRVKNNLQVISSLLELQGKKSTDAGIRDVLELSRNRLRSIALIHQNLYQLENNISTIEFKHFLLGLCNQVKEVFQKEKQKVQIIIDVPSTELDIDTAVPLGLILNELLTNSYKYAFNEVEEGTISINLQPLLSGTYNLIYRDNGPGMPENSDWQNSNTLGRQLIEDLVRQIGGSIQYEFEAGSKYRIKFTDQVFRKTQE